MELSQAKRLPHFGLYKAMGNIFVPVIGTVLLAIVALQYSRSAEAVSRLALAAITSGVAVIGFSYYKLRRGLNQLDGKISDEALSGLCLASNTLAMFGYLSCIMATLVHH